MRTIIDINDTPPGATKAHAAGERTTLKATIERALRAFWMIRGAVPVPPRPSRCSEGFKGVRPGVDLTDNAALEALMDAEPSLRGGVARTGLPSLLLLRRLWPFDAAPGPGRR